MIDFAEMSRLINEVGKLCDKTNAEITEIDNKIQKEREKAYFDMCTDLDPYRYIAKDLCDRKMGNSMVIPISDPEGIDGRYYAVWFDHGFKVQIVREYRGSGYMPISGWISGYSDEGFFPYNNHVDESNFDRICKDWYTKYSKRLAEEFTKIVQQKLADHAERMNYLYEKSKAELIKD